MATPLIRSAASRFAVAPLIKAFNAAATIANHPETTRILIRRAATAQIERYVMRLRLIDLGLWRRNRRHIGD